MVGIVAVFGIGCAVVSVYLWDPRPLAVWALIMVVMAATFIIVTGIHAVTIWPLVMLIARVFDGRRRTQVSRSGSAEPAAAPSRDPREPNENQPGSGTLRP